MPLDIHTYSVDGDFPNQVVGEDLLLEEIAGSSISQAVTDLNIGISGSDNADITFADTLTGPETTTLDGIVAVHSGEQSAAVAGTSDLGTTVDPTSSDDSSSGVGVGAIWVNTVTDSAFICRDSTVDAAIWTQFSFGSSPTTEEFKGQSDGVSTTTSSTFQTKVSIGPDTYSGGVYELLVSYGWNHDSNQNDFESRITIDGTPEGEEHRQEPKDSAGAFGSTGTDQKYYTASLREVSIPAGSHTVALEYRTTVNGDESSIWEAFVRLRKV